jgi:beta-lactamase superfamily II metal-dependent hydrolase
MRWSSDDGVTLDILAPSLPILADTGDDVTENSIVTRLTYRAGARVFRELFMGDAGEASEARLLTAGTDLRADAPIDSFERAWKKRSASLRSRSLP